MCLDDAPQFVHDAEKMVALDLWMLKKRIIFEVHEIMVLNSYSAYAVCSKFNNG